MDKIFPKKSESWKVLFAYFLFSFFSFALLDLLKLSDITFLWCEEANDIIVISLLFIYYSKKISDLSSFLLFFPKNFLKGFFAYFIIFLLTEELFVYFLSGEWKKVFFSNNPKWITILSTGGILAPIMEEVFFREIILKLMTLSYGLNKAVIFNGIIFGLLHFAPLPGFGWWSSIVSFAHGFFFAVLLCIVTNKTKNLSFAIGFHIANNFLTLLTS